jgi:arylesterase / paraoxonase
MLTRSPNSIHRLNVHGRALDDHFVALDIDSLDTAGGYSYKVLKIIGFPGVLGDGRIHAVGMSGTRSSKGIQLWLVNAQPSIDVERGQFLDNTAVGANSTIEVFELEPGSEAVRHVRTFADAQIATPNNVAVMPDGGFFFTNDHGPHKVGLVSGSESGFFVSTY